MYALKVIKALGPIDIKSVRRDALLRWMVFAPLFIGMGVRWAIPWLAAGIYDQLGFDPVPYYPLLMSIMVLLVAVLFGMITGFLLLDQRDDRTLMALQVTPLSLNGYFLYRTIVPMSISILGVMAVVPLSGLVSVEPVPLLIAALSASPLAPLFALGLASFAQNKVQGFALSKASGVLFLAPLVAYFVKSGWQLVFGLVPTYWPARLFWALQAGERSAWLYLLAGLAYQFLLLFLLLRRFNRVMSQ